MEKKVSIEYRVPYADTDQMKVVYYANYFRYYEMLRNELIRKSGVSYAEIEEKGLAFPVLEAHCEYHKSAKYDDILLITGWLSKVEGSRMQIDYEITTGGELLTTGNTVHVVITLDGKPRRVPEYMKAMLVSPAS